MAAKATAPSPPPFHAASRCCSSAPRTLKSELKSPPNEDAQGNVHRELRSVSFVSRHCRNKWLHFEGRKPIDHAGPDRHWPIIEAARREFDPSRCACGLVIKP